MKFYFIYGNDKSYRFSKILDERFRYIYLIVEILWNFEKYMRFYYNIGFIWEKKIIILRDIIM